MIFLTRQNLKDTLKSVLSKEEIDLVRASYDIIGNIAIIEVPSELRKKGKVIAQSIVKQHKNITTVAKKIGTHSGVYRTQKIKVIIGNKNTETLYKENSTRISLDIAKIYFSPRLATERLRIAKLAKPEEIILVLFSGCAPYPLVIAKNSQAKLIYGIEKNPIAHKYAVKNIKLNKLEKRVTLIKGDVKKVINNLGQKFDRIIMPLPKDSKSFIKEALTVAKNPCYLHYYTFSTIENVKHSALNIKDTIKLLGRGCEIIDMVKCGQYSPRVYRVCIDFLLK